MPLADSTTQVSAGTAEPDVSSCKRDEALAPFFAQLAARDFTEDDDPSISLSISVGGQVLTLDPWERKVVEKFGSGVDAEGWLWPKLVTQGLAFEAKCLSGSGRLETDEELPPEKKAELVDELITVASAGLAVFAELQSSINRLIGDGRMGDAEHLGNFRNRVGQSVALTRNLLGGDAFARAEAGSAGMLAAPVRTATKDTSAESDSRRPAPTQFKRDPAPTRMVHRSVVKKRTLVWPLLAVLVVCLAVWIGVTVTRSSYVAPPELTIEQFRHVEAIRKVEAKRPSVFVKLDRTAWSRIPREEQQDVIREIGIVAERAGYSGAQVWTTDGTAVGRWLKKTGARLATATGEGS
jgi:hypothetical protein